MSGHANTGDLGAVRADVSQSLRSIGLIIVFGGAALGVVAVPFSRFFESNFDNAQAMAFVIIAFLVGLVPFSAVFVLQRVFYSLEDTRTPFFVEVAKQTFFVGLALACTTLPTPWIGVGIAVATSAASYVQLVIFIVLVKRKLGELDGRIVLLRHVQFLIGALVATGVGIGITHLLGGYTADGFGTATMLGASTTILVTGLAMAGVYLGTLLALRNPELVTVIGLLRQRFGKRG